VKDNWINFIFFTHNRKNYSESIVEGISFHNKLSIKNPVYQNKCRNKCFLQGVESNITGEVELPVDIFLDEID